MWICAIKTMVPWNPLDFVGRGSKHWLREFVRVHLRWQWWRFTRPANLVISWRCWSFGQPYLNYLLLGNGLWSMFGIKSSNFFWGYGAIEPYPQYGRVCANVTHWPIWFSAASMGVRPWIQLVFLWVCCNTEQWQIAVGWIGHVEERFKLLLDLMSF